MRKLDDMALLLGWMAMFGAGALFLFLSCALFVEAIARVAWWLAGFLLDRRLRKKCAQEEPGRAARSPWTL